MQKINFQNLPNTTTPVNATNLNQLQTNVENAINLVSAYSTTETIIGTWIDGKPLYRKVINFGSLPNATSKEVEHNISNLDIIVKMEAVGNTASHYSLSIPYATTSNNISIYGSSTKIGIATETNRSSFSTYVILEYTKTTD